MDWESAWEASILDNTQHCVIWGYDHQTKSFGRQVSHASFSKKQRTHFASHVQLGPVDKHGRNDEPKLYTLSTIMKNNGHAFIDILKIDIEGYEFDTLREIVQPYIESGKPLPFGQLQIELHLWNKKFADFLGWWQPLEAAGLRPVMMEPNLVYANYNRGSGAELAEVRASSLPELETSADRRRSTRLSTSRATTSLSRTPRPHFLIPTPKRVTRPSSRARTRTEASPFRTD